MSTLYWDSSSGTNAWNMSATTSATTTQTIVGSYEYPVIQDVKINSRPVKAKILSNFPFKKNSYQGLAEQLQGEFDKWIGNARQDIFA